MKEIPFTWKGARMKCLIDKCDSDAKVRGLCQVCYQAASIAISRGETTWEQLEQMRFANKPQHKSRGNGAFAKALCKLNENKALRRLNGEEGL